ncbi:MAG TPA: DNA-3-methyladenine glycosylase [Steroidobacteraceae bacterium]
MPDLTGANTPVAASDAPNAQAIAHLTRTDPVMAGLIGAVGPCGLLADTLGSPFQTLAQAITHQQLNGTAARTILTRFIQCCGKAGAFPTPQEVVKAKDKTLRAAGLSFAKIAALKDLARKTLDGTVPEHDTLVSLPDEQIIERLTQVRGIGRWTVEMMLMFRLGRPDILPADDFGVRAGFKLTYGLRQMPAPRALAAYAEKWSPHRTVAAWYLWRAVEWARAGKLPLPAEKIKLKAVRRKKRKSAKKKNVGKKKSVRKKKKTKTTRSKRAHK